MESPLVSIVIAVFENAHLTAVSLDSILHQTDQRFEIILVLTKDTKKQVHNLRDYSQSIAKTIITEEKTISAMMNKGMKYAKGKYLQFVLPGEAYLSKAGFSYIAKEIESSKDVDLFYCSSILFNEAGLPEVMDKEFSYETLSSASMVTRLESCWIEKKFLEKVGKFDSSYFFREGYDFMCRLILIKDIKIKHIKRIIMDYENYIKTSEDAKLYAYETIYTIYKNFGLRKTLSWIIFKDHFKFLRIWIRGSIKTWLKEA